MLFGLRITASLCYIEIYDMDNICGFSATSINYEISRPDMTVHNIAFVISLDTGDLIYVSLR
jgi:hypothetical protein